MVKQNPNWLLLLLQLHIEACQPNLFQVVLKLAGFHFAMTLVREIPQRKEYRESIISNINHIIISI